MARPPAGQRGKGWEGEASFTINNFHAVKSLYDLAAEDKSLSPQQRELLEIERYSLRIKDGLALQTQTTRFDTFLVCDITVRNLKRDELQVERIPAESLSLVSTEGEIFPALSPLFTFEMRHIRFPSGKLLPNGRAVGKVVFLVKQGTRPQQIVYKPNP